MTCLSEIATMQARVDAATRLAAKAAHAPWIKPELSTTGLGYCLDVSGPFGPEHVAVENRYTAAFICAIGNLWEDIVAERAEMVEAFRQIVETTKTGSRLDITRVAERMLNGGVK